MALPAGLCGEQSHSNRRWSRTVQPCERVQVHGGGRRGGGRARVCAIPHAHAGVSPPFSPVRGESFPKTRRASRFTASETQIAALARDSSRGRIERIVLRKETKSWRCQISELPRGLSHAPRTCD